MLAGLVALHCYVKPTRAVPGGSSDTKVANSFSSTALGFTPDRGMLLASKTGQLYVYDQEGNKLANPALDPCPEVCDNSKRDLLGVAMDPRFGTEGHDFVYLYYTPKTSDICPTKDPGSNKNPVNLVMRFAMVVNTADKASKIVLIGNIPSPNGSHNGGDSHFGGDDKLYGCVGDGGCAYVEKTKD